MEKVGMADIRRIAPVFLKALFVALAVTAVEIGALSLLLYKTDMSENSLHIAVIAGYGIACFLSGLYCGKKCASAVFCGGCLQALFIMCFFLRFQWRQKVPDFHYPLFLPPLSVLAAGCSEEC